MHSRLVLTLGFIAIVVAGCSYSTPTTPTTATGPVVNIQPGSATYDMSKGTATVAGFSPSTLTVQVGATVTWTNNDSVTHQPTANDGAFSGTVGAYATFSHVFTSAGTVPYHDVLYPGMTGTIIVQ